MASVAADTEVGNVDAERAAGDTKSARSTSSEMEGAGGASEHPREASLHTASEPPDAGDPEAVEPETVEVTGSKPAPQISLAQSQDPVAAIVTTPPAAAQHGHGLSISSAAPMLPNLATATRRQPSGAPGRKLRSKKTRVDILSMGQDGWAWELAGALIGTMLIVTIVGLLSGYNEKAQPEWWKGRITLPGLAAVVGTVAKAASLMAVTAAISQLKWLWYRQDNKDRKTTDLELFDSASRGPWGSLLLTFTLNGWSIARIGTIIVVASMFWEFAIQQSIRTGVRTSFDASDDAKVSRLQEYTRSMYGGDWKTLISDPLGSAAYNGLISGTGRPNLKPACNTASCTWPRFSSLGICSSCSDISQQVIQGQHCDTSGWESTPKCTIQLAGQLTTVIEHGYNGNGPGSHFNSSAYFLGKMVGFYGLGKDKWAGIWYPIVSIQNFEYKISHLGVKKFKFDLLSATECALYACVKTYNISVVDGTSHENVVSIWHNDSMPGESHGTQIPPLYLDPPRTTNDSHLDGSYILNGEAQSDISTFMYNKFKGLITVSSSSNLALSNEDLRLIYAQGNVTQVVDNIALSLTDSIQTGSGSEPVSGKQSYTEIYVRVRWGWLSFPVTLTVLSVIFLLLTMYVTKVDGAKVWKSSTLALLYHGLEYPATQEGFPLDDLSDMDRLARVTRLRLDRDETAALRFMPAAVTH